MGPVTKSGMTTGEGTHLYHATKPAVIAHTKEQEAQFRADGYQEEYIFQEFPKAVTIGTDEDGNAIQKTARNAEEEAAILAAAKPEVIE